MGGRWIRIGAALALAALALSACQMELGVGAKLRRDGSGVFTIAVAADKEFVQGLAQAPGGTSQQGFGGFEDLFRSLRAKGWRVKDTRTQQGDVALNAQCDFRSPKDFDRCLGELSSAEGGREGLRLRDAGLSFDFGSRRGFFKTRTFFAGAIDLAGPAQGRSPDFVKQLQAVAERVFTFEVRADLPGPPRVLEGAGEASVKGDLVTWTPKIGEKLRFRAESDSWNAGAIALAGLPALLLLGIGIWLLARRRPAPALDAFLAPAEPEHETEVTAS